MIRLLLLLSLLLISCAPVRVEEVQGNSQRSFDSSMYLSKPMFTAAPTATAIPESRIARVTFYSSSKEERTGNITASGLPVGPETAASNDLEFGTEIHLEGIGRRVITDRGSRAIDVDCYEPDRNKAIELGVKYVTLTVVKRP